MKYSRKITDVHSLNLAFSTKVNDLKKDFEAIKSFEESIKQLNQEIETAMSQYDLNRAGEINYDKIPALNNEIEIIKERIRDQIKKVMIDVLNEI